MSLFLKFYLLTDDDNTPLEDTAAHDSDGEVMPDDDEDSADSKVSVVVS